MATRTLSERTVAGRRAAERLRQIGQEIRRLRLEGGISQRRLAEAAGVAAGFLSHVERGERQPSLAVMESLASALGADLSVHLYPNTGPTIHDRLQGPMVESLLFELHRRWQRFVEVVVRRPSRGVIDVVVADLTAQLVIAIEVESGLRRLEQQLRWSADKAESLPSSQLWAVLAATAPPTISRALLLRNTRSTRAVAGTFERALATAYPARHADAVAALRGVRPWPGPAVLWAEVTGGTAVLRDTPPRGISLGR